MRQSRHHHQPGNPGDQAGPDSPAPLPVNLDRVTLSPCSGGEIAQRQQRAGRHLLETVVYRRSAGFEEILHERETELPSDPAEADRVIARSSQILALMTQARCAVEAAKGARQEFVAHHQRDDGFRFR